MPYQRAITVGPNRAFIISNLASTFAHHSRVRSIFVPEFQLVPCRISGRAISSASDDTSDIVHPYES